jgi:hypothetical protein
LLGDGSHHNLVAEVQAQEDFMAIDVRSLVPLLQVFDMPASINFYCGVLGFEVVSTDSKQAPNFDWVLLRRGAYVEHGLRGAEPSDDT